MRHFSDKPCRGNRNTVFTFRNFFSKNGALYEMWRNTVQQDRPQMAI